ncbi:MAG: chromosome partitioning protein [Gammaproteobacteria bacterium]|jgi:chromosome partitioning protein
MLRIMLLNPKGGCGKTTIATSLASYYAASGLRTALEDHDSQGSSTRWLDVRPSDAPAIHGIAAFRAARGVTRSWQMRLPTSIERVVVDTAAGLDTTQVPEMVQRADFIVVPVLPSRIDMDAAHDFLAVLARTPALRQGKRRVAVVANRLRGNRRLARELKAFLAEQQFPFVASLRDSSNYERTAELGVGVHDLDVRRAQTDRNHWQPLLEWLDSDHPALLSDAQQGIVSPL